MAEQIRRFLFLRYLAIGLLAVLHKGMKYVGEPDSPKPADHTESAKAQMFLCMQIYTNACMTC